MSEAVVGYGFRFDGLIKRMITDRLSSNEDITDLRSYLDEYHKIISEIKQIKQPEE